MAPQSITSDEINFLIYRYLQESGYIHTGFTFAYESSVIKTNINGDDVPPGALITFLQKGLQFIEIETHLKEDGSEMECDSSFSLLKPHSCSVKDLTMKVVPEKEKEREKRKEKENMKEKEKDKRRNSEMETDVGPVEEDDAMGEVENNQPPAQISPNDVLTLRGHTSEVFICQWSPTQNLLASGSGDASARIWSIPTTACSASQDSTALQLRCFTHSKDVTTLDWSGDGTMLATGSFDGQARIWSEKGDLKFILERHKGPIFSLKWNKKGDLLLSGSVDKTAIIWDAKYGTVRQQFEFHSAPTLDVDWRNNTTFATCSNDKMIYVCKLGEARPVKAFQGHKDEVNAIKWDPSGNLLASCSDDATAKIWNPKQDEFVHDFVDHTKEIYTIKWSPSGPGSNNPNQKLVLASASFDGLVKLWDVEVGTCVQTLTKHTDPVYSVAFSPDGNYIASGSFDRCLHIWSVRDGKLIRTYQGDGGIFEVSWNSTGDKVAACFSNNTVCVVDFPLNRASVLA